MVHAITVLTDIFSNQTDGRHELHVPESFTAEMPALTFSQLQFPDVRLDDHPSAKHIPKPSGEAYTQQVYTDEHTLREFTARADFPKNFQEMSEARLPQVSLHVTSFADATIVSLTWPHTLMDAVGQQDLLKAWSLSLAGRLQDVPEVLGTKEDVLTALHTPDAQPEPLAIDSQKLGSFGMFSFFTRLALRYLKMMVTGNKRHTRMVFMPKAAVDKLKQRAAKDVPPGEFVSTGDVLTSWMLHNLMKSLAKPKPLSTLFLVNGRYRLPWLSSEKGIYLQNLVSIAHICFPSQLAGESSGSVAREFRRQLQLYGAEAEIQELMRQTHKYTEKNGRPPLSIYGESDGMPVFFNNLAKPASLEAADFGPAVVRQGEDSATRSNPVGTAVLYLHRPLHRIPILFDSFYILGKDHAGNYWLMGIALQQTWDRFDDEIRSLKHD